MTTETMTAAEAQPRGVLAFLRVGRGSASPPGALQRGKGKGWLSGHRLMALVVMLAMVLGGVLGLGATAARAAAEDKEVMSFTFYRVASSTTALFSTVQDPANDGTFPSDWQAVMTDAGSAGSLLGYADPNFSDVQGWLAAKLSGSSDAIGYDTLKIKDADGNTVAGGQQGMLTYAYFGAALKGMGLDGTSTGLSLGFMNFLMGGVVMILYVLSGAVDFLFFAVMAVLKLLNPFKLFYVGVAAISPEFASGMVGGDSSQGALSPFFSGLASWIGGWYKALNGLAWTVMVPLFIAIFVVGLLLFKKMNRGGALKKILIRIAFLGLGLPLVGMMYTGMVNSMADATESGNSGSTRVVMSTYVDFEGWAMESRLAVPDGAVIAWSAHDNQPSGTAQSNVRNTALAINNRTHNLGLAPIISSGATDASWSNQAFEGGEDERKTTASKYLTGMDVLVRYMNNSQVSAASFETAAKGQLSTSSFYRDNRETVKSWFEDMTKDAKKANPVGNPLVAVSSGNGLIGTMEGGNRVFSSNTSGCSVTGTTITYDGKPRACNLAPLAMYNYLNTDFGSTSMTMYSSSNVMSEATRSIHNSVNQVGTGTMSLLYWFNAVVLLGSFVLIGFGYAFAILFTNIRRSFQIMTAVPFATLGAIAAIAKVLVYAIALVLEVIVTIFLYKIVQEFLVSLPQIIEMPFAAALNNGGTGDFAGFIAFLTSGWAFGLVVTLLSIIGVTVFTVMALRARKALVKAMEEAVTKIVEKFTETSIGTPGGGGKMAPALAGGLAAGAGAAAASRMMGGGNRAKGPQAGALPGTSGGGPEAVSVGGTPGAPGGGGDDAGGGAGGLGALTGGGGSESTVDGDIGVGDGTLGIEGGSNGDPGTQAAIGAGTDGAGAETAAGRQVEANGLTEVDTPGHASGVAAGEGAAEPGVAGGTSDSKGAQADAGDVMADSLDKSAQGYADADKQKLGAGKEGVEATGHAAAAVGRGFAGDAAGAAESGGRAVEHGGRAAAAGERSKQAEQDAGRSSLDKPNQKHAQRAQKAEQVSAAGAGVANVAGMANGGATSKAGAAGKQAPKQAATQPPVRGGGQGAPQRSGQGQQRPAAQQQPRQQAQPQRPAPRQAAPVQQPRQQAPAPRPASVVSNNVDRRTSVTNKAAKKPTVKKVIKPIKPGAPGKGDKGGKRK